jgi:hypothetical protein
MTWGAILRDLLTDPLAWALALVVGLAAALGGYFYGQHAQAAADTAETNAALVQAFNRARTAEAKLSTEINGVSNEYETKIAALKSRVDSANVELGRLRVKPRCSLPTIAPAASEPNATAESGTNGPTAGEIDLDGVAKQVIELGSDFDAANIRIIELQYLVNKYANACKIN